MKKTSKNKTIICIDTTSEVCGVALIQNDLILYENNINNGYNHSITLFNNIHNSLLKNKIDMSAVDEIRVSSGPGSFTGIRIGVAAAIGLSEKYNTKICYIDTLDSLAYNVIGNNDIIISMIDAKCNRVYLSLYFSKNLKKIHKDLIVNINDLCDELNNKFTEKNIYFSFVGSGVIKYMDILDNNLSIKYKLFPNKSNLKASSLAYINSNNNILNINYLLSSKAERDRNVNC